MPVCTEEEFELTIKVKKQLQAATHIRQLVNTLNHALQSALENDMSVKLTDVGPLRKMGKNGEVPQLHVAVLQAL